MKTFQTLSLQNVLIALVCVGMLLASSAANSAVANVPATAIATAAQQGLATFEPSEPSVFDSHAASVTLPPLAVLAPSQKWGALFPVVGIVAAVAVTQLLRRRRLAQLRADSSFGQ
jgi:hypothetical protein